jgi:alpha,alpha-trehalase
MLENFSQLVDKFGLIPNGNRVYYKRRSQPPLFVSMVEEYFNATNDITFLNENLPRLDREFAFWRENRMRLVQSGGRRYDMAVYNVKVDGPRPESYREDYTDAQKFATDEEKQEFYFNMKAGAESGWDYSSKWFADPSTGNVSLSLLDIKARHIVPVELNSFLCRNARVLSRFHAFLGNASKATEYAGVADQLEEAIDRVLWNEEDGAWYVSVYCPRVRLTKKYERKPTTPRASRAAGS